MTNQISESGFAITQLIWASHNGEMTIYSASPEATGFLKRMKEIRALLENDDHFPIEEKPGISELEKRFISFVKSEDMRDKIQTHFYKALPHDPWSLLIQIKVPEKTEIVVPLAEHAQKHDVNPESLERYGRTIIEDMIRKYAFPDELSIVLPYEVSSDDPPERLSEEIMERLKWGFYHDYYRKFMRGWEKELKPGTIRIVEALMGLGKTYEYVRTLARTNLSAMIFLPTKAMIDKVEDDFKKEGAGEDVHRIYGIDEEGKIGVPGCVHYEEIVENQKYGIYGRGIYCKDCEVKFDCIDRGILRSERDIHEKRIVLTTHAQYLRFASKPKLAYYKPRDNEEPKKRPRDVWIIDEDLLLQCLYTAIGKPITLGTVQDVIDGLKKAGIQKEEFDQFYKLLKDTEEDTIAPPLNPDLTFSAEEDEAWANEIGRRVKTKRRAANRLEPVADAIRYGCHIQKYGEERYARSPSVKKIAIEELPAHVFFDGTPPPDDFFKKVYGDSVAIESCNSSSIKRIPRKTIIPMPGSLKIFHTNTQDLPKTKREDQRINIFEYLKYVIRRESTIHQKENIPLRIFIATTKAHEQDLRESKKEWTNLTVLEPGKAPPKDEKLDEGESYIIIDHWRGFRGSNAAKNCHVGILLGTYFVKESVVIARALPYMSPERPPILVKDVKRWSNGLLVFKEPCQEISKRMREFWYAEQKQAMTRMRHLYHWVRCYVVSRYEIDLEKEFTFVSEGDYCIDTEGLKAIEIEPKTKQDKLYNFMRNELYSKGCFTRTDVYEYGTGLGISKSYITGIINKYAYARKLEVREDGRYVLKSIEPEAQPFAEGNILLLKAMHVNPPDEGTDKGDI